MAFTKDEIVAGDVLLFRGTSKLAWLIRLFDGSRVNHAAIALGGGRMGEAAAAGLQSAAVPTPGAGEFVVVRRLQASEDLGPVVAKAQAFLAEGHLYAYQQLVLLALLGMTRSVKLPRIARPLIRSVLDHAARAIMDLLPVGSTWMICSEYVFRSFDEADSGPDSPYDLLIADMAFGPEDGGPTLLDWGLDNVRDVTAPVPPVTFSFSEGADPAVTMAVVEAELAPLITTYAQALLDNGEITPDELPPLLDPSFGPPPEPPADPTDDELLAAMARFGDAVTRARSGGTAVSFGPIGAAIGAAALKGALEGIRDISADSNFVTPRDLLVTASLRDVGQIG